MSEGKAPVVAADCLLAGRRVGARELDRGAGYAHSRWIDDPAGYGRIRLRRGRLSGRAGGFLRCSRVLPRLAGHAESGAQRP